MSKLLKEEGPKLTMVWTCSDEVNGEREPDGGQDGAQDRAQDGRGPNRPNPINDISGTRANQTSSTMAGPESPLMTRPPVASSTTLSLPAQAPKMATPSTETIFTSKAPKGSTSSAAFQKFHCGQCRKTFASCTAVRAHRKMRTCQPSNQETACSVEHEHEPLNLLFDSMDEALNWRVENQLDRYFSFKGSKSTRGVLGAYRYLRCNQNVKDKIAGAKKSKKAYLCSARITFNQTEMCCCPDPQSDLCLNAKQQVKVYGCVAHSHPMGRKNIRLSKIVKDRTASLLSSGITSEVVIDKYMSINDLDPQSKPVTYDDIYRIKKSLNLEGYDGKASEVRNVSNLLIDPSFRGFNYGKKFDVASMPEDIVGKVIETSGYFLLTYASPEMIQRFHDHPTIVSIDGTHGTNASKFVLITIVVFGIF
ncbi:uncharacterized protein LOC131884377 isoform X2 [Tigriopus californicus]|uniref:uncharacterized protein LOC131884377 isoform X2 n=1 Tax=Tigriopus californicus TaxID=6832 RepID=UPI0027DA74F5|nr:uncharacterized protein LOC131884377 isoform X2 [Tigriopus californicus]